MSNLAKFNAVFAVSLLAVATPLSAAWAQDATAQDEATSDTSDLPIGNFGARLAYNSSVGAVAGVDFVTARVFGRPHQLALSADISETDRRLSFDYVIPSLSQEQPNWGFSVFRNDSRASDAFDFDTLSFGVKPSYSWQLSDTARLTAFLDVSSNEISNIGAGSSQLITQDLGQRDKTALGLVYQWQDARTAFKFTTSLASTSDDTRFSKTEISATRQWSADDARLQISSTVNMGNLAMMQGASNIGDRFFLGSSQMRGFGRAGLGPRDLSAGEAALGGNSYAALKVDVKFMNAFANQGGFVPGVFFDSGSLWGLDSTAGGTAGANAVDDTRYNRSVVGLSAQFDLGPAALNIFASHPINKQSYDSENQLQLSISTDF
jgi:outer membrane protein insertion porin family